MTKTKHSIVFPPFASCIDAVLRIRTGLLEAAARKTDRRIILSSCLAWSLDVLGICLVRSCHLRSSFFRFLQHPCPAALRNGEAKCKRSWSKREISWKYIGVSTMCLDTASECRQIFCIDSASAKRLQSKLVDGAGARVSSFLALMLTCVQVKSISDGLPTKKWKS